MWLVDQLLCGSGLTPAISCTRFKIHSAHADSPVAKTGFLRFRFREDQLSLTDQETQEENVLSGPTPLLPCYLLYKVQDPFSACGESYGQNIFFYFFNVLGRFVCDSQTKRLRNRMCLVDQLPRRSVLTRAISRTKIKIHSAHADSPMPETCFYFYKYFREEQPLIYRQKKNSERERAWWTNSLVGQFLHQPSLVQRSI